MGSFLDLIPLLQGAPSWFRALTGGLIGLLLIWVGGLAYLLISGRLPAQAAPPPNPPLAALGPAQAQTVTNSPGATVIQAQGDVLIGGPSTAQQKQAEELEHQRWDALNSARFNISDVRFAPYRDVTYEEAQLLKGGSSPWGYEPDLVFPATQYRPGGKGYLACHLMLVDSTGKILHSNPLFTVAEAHEEAARRKLRPGSFSLVKHYTLQIEVRNRGKTDAVGATVRASQRATPKAITIYESEAPFRANAEFLSTINSEVFLPIEVRLKDLTIDVEFSFSTFDGKKVDQHFELPYRWMTHDWGILER